jgi:hypothetical protein
MTSDAPGDDDDGGDDAGDVVGRCGDPGSHADPAVPPATDGRITINEVMASNALTISDDTGVTSDWVELYNPGDEPVPLGGYSLTTDFAEPRRAIIDDSVAIPAGGHVLLWLDGEPQRGAEHMCAKLSQYGGAIGLARPDGSYIDRVVYGEQVVDLAAARTPDGSDRWQIVWGASPGDPNPDGDGEPAPDEASAPEPEQIPAAGDVTERILGYDEMPEIELLVDDEAAAALVESPYTYVPGTIVFEGRAYGPVGVRLKGQNSFQPFYAKPSFRINIDEYVGGAKFLALDDLTLNNMNDDYSMMHERVAYMIARQVGPASRSNHALVTVNGQFYGLYANVETGKWHMISRWFDDPTGPLFEGTDVDFTAPYIPSYEHQSGPDDRSMLIDLADALTLASPDAAIAAAADYVNLSQFQDFWAMCAITGQFDSFPFSDPGDDYFVYADPTTQRLWLLPWGMDETFYSAAFDVGQVRSVLATNCRDSAACYQGFVDATWDLLEMTEQMNLAAELDRVAAQIAPHVARDTRKRYDDATVAEYQMQMRWFVTGRRVWLSEMLPPPSYGD